MEMLNESNGTASSMRVMSFVSLIMAVIIGLYLVYNNPADPSTGVYVFTSFLVGAFCPKMIQKFAEQKVT